MSGPFGRFASVVIVVALILMLVPGSAFGLVTKATSTLSLGKFYTFGPSVSGKLVAWTEQPVLAAPYEVWVRRANGTVKRVSTTGMIVDASQGPTAFGGRWVVWSQEGDDGAGGTQINLFGYDDTTDAVTQLTHSTTQQVRPAGNGMTVIWVARNPGGHTLMTGLMPGLSSVMEVTTHTASTITATCLYGSQAGYCVALNATPGLTHYVSEDVATHGPEDVAVDDGAHGPESTSISYVWWAWDRVVGGEYRAFVKSRSSGLTEQTPLAISSTGQNPSVSANCVAYSGLSAAVGGGQEVFHYEMLSGDWRQVSTGGDTRYVGLGGRRAAYTQRTTGTWGVKLAQYNLATDRIGGADRFVVAADAARVAYGASWTGADYVVVASGDNAASADPLAAAGLCWKYDAPLLLVSASKMPPATLTAMQQIKVANPAAKVIVIGGAGSVPESRMVQMRSVFGAGNVERLLATGDRYDMAAKIAERMRLGPGGRTFPADPIALIANGADSTKFFDALSLSAVSRASGNPILLVKAGSVPLATQEALTAMAPQGVVVAGGTGTVNGTVFTQVGGTARWSGADRYETSEQVALGAIDNGYNIPSSIALAAKLPDGLSGGAMVGRARGVLLVTKGTGLSAAPADFASTHYPDAWRATALGGTGSIYPAVLTQFDGRLNP